jgi:hypothetical protein
MERLQFIDYKGKRILIEDFTRLMPGGEFNKSIKAAQKIIAAEPENSVLAIFDATDSSFNAEMLEQIKKFTKANSPYIKTVCVVGLNGLLQIALSAVIKFTGREFNTFRTRQEALDFLAGIE